MPALPFTLRLTLRLRHLLLALLLCLAQIGWLAHVVEHARNEGGSPHQVCALCLAADHLAAPPAAPPVLPALAADFLWLLLPCAAVLLTRRCATPPVRGPPH